MFSIICSVFRIYSLTQTSGVLSGRDVGLEADKASSTAIVRTESVCGS